MAAQTELKIAGIPFATWIQIVTTIATVMGAFSVLHSQIEIATMHVQEMRQDIKDIRIRELENEKGIGTRSNKIDQLDRRVSELEAQRNRVPN